MNEENVKRVIDLIQDGINQISEQLGVALPHLWEVLVRQQVISGIINLFFIVPVIFGWVLVYKLFKVVLIKENKSEHYDDTGGLWVGLLFAGCTVGLFTFVYLANLSSIITSIVNPEYHALKEILDTIKGGK